MLGGLRGIAIAIFFTLVAFVCGCSERRAEPPIKAEYRWAAQEWNPIENWVDVTRRFDGRGDFTIRAWPPVSSTRDRAVKLTNVPTLQEVDWGDAAIYDARRPTFPVVSLPADHGPLVMHFRSTGHVSVSPPLFGKPRDLIAGTLADELPISAVGALLFLLGTLIGTAGSAFRRQPRYVYLGAFASSLGVVFTFQADAIRSVFVSLSSVAWFWTYQAASFGYLLSFLLFVDAMFGGGRDRWLRAIGATSILCGIVCLVLALQDRWSPASIGHVSALGVFALTPRVLWLARQAARAGDSRAGIFFWGFAAMIGFAFPDLMWALGHQFIPFNTSPYGGLAFVVALGVMLESHERAQSHELSEKLLDLGRLNVELRRQIAQRSKELADVLQGRELQRAKLSAGSAVDGRYEVLRFLGQGGMGSVFEAARLSDGKRVALKVMAGDVSKRDAARFIREAEIAARLEHPSLLPVLDVGLTSGTPFLVMDLASDGNLDDRRDHFGDLAWVVPLLRQIADGLSALHAGGIVHRDLKPANVLLVRDGDTLCAKIGDFGISRVEEKEIGALDATARKSLTATGAALGTPLYMAPETLNGRATPAADMFAFGAMAYEMLTGKMPYEMPPIFEVIAGKTVTTPAKLRGADVKLPTSTLDLLDTCLSANEKQRPTASAVVAALNSLKKSVH